MLPDNELAVNTAGTICLNWEAGCGAMVRDKEPEIVLKERRSERA